MDIVLVDTDIIMDLLTQRHPFYNYAARLFTMADKQEINICASSLCFNNLDYLLSKQYNKQESRRILTKLKILLSVLAVDDKIISMALASSFSDFEDAIQYYTALENNIGLLITRNLKDYKKAEIAVMTAESFLKKQLP